MSGVLQQSVIWRRAALLAVVCVVLAATASSDAIHAALLDLLHATEEVIATRPVRGAVAFVIFAALSALFTFFSIAIVVPVAVVAWGELASVLLLWSGWLLGGVLTYSVGRFLGRAVVRWLTARDALSELERRVQHDAPFWLVLLLQLALPSEVTGYLLGLLRYRAGLFLLALALAELPYALATVYLGVSLVEGRGAAILGIGSAVALVCLAALYAVHRVLDERKKS